MNVGTVLELRGYPHRWNSECFLWITGEHGNSVQFQQIYIEYLLCYS